MFESSTGPLHAIFRYMNNENYLVVRLNDKNQGTVGLYQVTNGNDELINTYDKNYGF